MYMLAGTDVRMYVCVHVCVYEYIHTVYIHACIYVCMYVCMFVYIYVYVCVCVQMYSFVYSYAVDKNKPHFSTVPEGRPQRDRWKSLQADEKGKRKQTIFRPRIYRLETFKNLLRSISSGPFQCPVSGLRTEQKVRIQFKGFVLSKSVAN